MAYYVYIMSNRPRGTLYVGITSDLERRANQHKQDRSDSFVARYKLHTMVWAQAFDDAAEAIQFEKRLKRWRRDWKITLVEQANPNWENVV